MSKLTITSDRVYRSLTLSLRSTFPTATQILFVVQDGERNVFDQRWLEYELLEKYVFLPHPHILILIRIAIIIDTEFT